MKSKNNIIGYAGLSHLGIVSSISTAEKNNLVICYDNNTSLVEDLKKKKFPIQEKNLSKYYKKNLNNIKFTTNINELNKCNIIYISKDIKTNSDGKSDLKEVKKIIKNIILNIKKDKILVILCQVPPNFTKKIKWPKDKLYYQVETLIFGNAFERSLKPERIIVGAEKKNYIDIKYKNFLHSYNCPIIQMNYESAELSKIAINLFLISQVSTTNSIVEIASSIGANWTDIQKALKLDKRIGQHSYLKPGLGLSGGNLERDLETIKSLGEKNKTNINLFEAFIKTSVYYKGWVNKKLDTILKNNQHNKFTIGLLGLTYKENTNSIKNSPSIDLIKKNQQLCFCAYDPSNISPDNYKNLVLFENYKDVLNKSEIIIIFNQWEHFSKIKQSDISASKKLKIIIDPFGVLKKINFDKLSIDYKTIN